MSGEAARPRVLALTHSLSGVDGVGRYAAATLRHLLPRCARIELFIDRDHRGFAEDMPRGEHLVVHESLPCGGFPFLPLPRLAWLLLRSGPGLVAAARRADVVHSLCDYPLGFVATLVARIARRPVVVSGHGTYSVAPLSMPGHAALLRWTYRNLDRFLTGSAYAMRQVRAVAEPRGPEVVPYGCDPRDSDAAAAAGESPGVPRPYLLCVGEVKRRKGYTISLPAFLGAWRRRPELHFAVVGRFDTADPYYQDLAAEIARAGAGGHVHFLGNVSEARKVALMRGAQAFLLTPIVGDRQSFEAFGLVFLEAGAAGRPVVGVTESGAEDAITDGENGFLRRREDVEGLAEVLVRLVEDPELADRLGRAGRARAEGQTWERAAARVHALYAELQR